MKNLELRDFLQYNFLSKLQASPDGRHAAVVSSKANLDANNYDSVIHLIELGTTAIRQLTYTGDSASFIWLSDSELLFPATRLEADKAAQKRGEKLTVFQKISIGGGEACEYFRVPYNVKTVKKVNDNLFALLCQWHPEDYDFASMDEARKKEVFAQIEENRDYEVLDEIPFWANGGGFTNKKRNRLFLFELDTKKMTAITDESTNVHDFKVKDGKIAYVANSFTDKMALQEGAYCYDTASGATETVVPCKDYSIQWLEFYRDGFIMTASVNDKFGMNQNKDFYTVSGGKITMLASPDEQAGIYTNSDSRYGAGTTIKLHGDAVYYTGVQHVQNVLRKLNPDGSIDTLLKMNETVDGFDFGEGGLIYYGLGATFLQEVFVVKDGKPERISSFNTEFLSDKKLSTPEYLEAQGEWATVEGFVLKPVDFEPGAKYPAILHIHGGPKTAYGDTYFHEAQLWANRGYFVLMSNPWGSDGRGNEFADLRGRYGTVDYNDLMTFTDKAMEVYPQIDGTRLGVGGGSYGGFMTNWIIGHTDRFSAAVSMRSISNWISKFNTTDIGYFFNADQVGATPWDDHEKMWWHSPIKYADKCVTPTLFIHAEEDYRCWLAEGLQMYTALKYHGVPARLCMFRGENHELSRSGKPKHRIRRLTEIVNWFDKYCKE